MMLRVRQSRCQGLSEEKKRDPGNEVEGAFL